MKTRRPTVHLICNAHLDPVWQWRWEEGCAEALSTFRNAVILLRAHPSLIFNHNEAVLYRWVRQYDPSLFREIQELVRDGRWCISGGWYLQPDVNIPGAESIIRQMTEGRKFFLEHFGVRPRVAYNFDSFGHSGGLPQILVRAGYQMYIHMRPGEEEMHLPSDLYRWRGVDGSEIVAFRPATGFYHSERDDLRQRIEAGVERAIRINRDVPVFWGLGDHGGGPTRKDLQTIDEMARTEERVVLQHSTPDRLFEALQDASREAPVVAGDLQRAFTGCYTSLFRVKQRAQRNLAELTQAESLRAITWWRKGQEYPAEELAQAWRDHLFNDFHDILPGSCIEPAERDALDLYGRSSHTLRRLRLAAVTRLNSGPLQDFYIPVTVTNTIPVLERAPVEVEGMLDYRPRLKGKWHLRVHTIGSDELPSQEEAPESLLPYNGWRRKVVFMAETPAGSVSHYDVRAASGKQKPAVRKSTGLVHRIDNKTGFVRSLLAGQKRECLDGPLFEPLVVEDKGDSWGTGCWRYRKILGRFQAVGSAHTVEDGPVRRVTESVYRHASSRIVLRTIAYRDWPILEFRYRLTWNESHKRLKLSIPTALHEPILSCEVPGGAIDRPADGEEYVHGRWFVLRGNSKGGPTALAVINSGQHGLDFKDGEVRLSILRSPAYCHDRALDLRTRREVKIMDQGVHEFRLLVTAGDPETVQGRVTVLSDWLDSPPLVYAHLPIGRSHEEESGTTPFIRILPPTVRLMALKRSWDGKDLIVRLHQTAGEPADGAMTIESPSLKIPLQFRPFEIKTLRIGKRGTWKEVNLIEEI